MSEELLKEIIRRLESMEEKIDRIDKKIDKQHLEKKIVRQ